MEGEFILDAGDAPVFDNSTSILSKSLTFDTTTGGKKSEFYRLVLFLRQSFPLVNEHLEFVEFEFGMMFIWKGSDRNLEPIVLMSHMDTVPVPEENLGKWDFPPFSGSLSSDKKYIYGRGSLDTKSTLVGSMNAVEVLLKEKFVPIRSIYLCYGFDEEIVDEEYGAKNMSNYLKELGVKPFLVLDEGGYISKRSSFFEGYGINGNVARIGVAEKQFLGLNISVQCDGGHGSVPDMKNTCIYKLGRVIQRLIDQPMKSHIGTKVVQSFLVHVFPNSSSFKLRLIFSTLIKWFPNYFGDYFLSKDKRTNTMIRTTFAPTIIKGGFYENSLPRNSWMVVNVRIHPGDTLESTLEHIRKTINDKSVRVQVMKFEGSNQVADFDSVQYETIVNTARAVFKGIEIHTPELLPFTTDLKHYRKLTKNCFNFWPYVLDGSLNDWGRIHANNERISVEGYMKVIQFYIVLLKNLQVVGESMCK